MGDAAKPRRCAGRKNEVAGAAGATISRGVWKTQQASQQGGKRLVKSCEKLDAGGCVTGAEIDNPLTFFPLFFLDSLAEIHTAFSFVFNFLAAGILRAEIGSTAYVANPNFSSSSMHAYLGAAHHFAAGQAR